MPFNTQFLQSLQLFNGMARRFVQISANNVENIGKFFLWKSLLWLLQNSQLLNGITWDFIHQMSPILVKKYGQYWRPCDTGNDLV